MHTHRIEVAGDAVRKTFVSLADGEADREWAGLVALHAAVPDLVPRPIAREEDGGAPVVVMSRLPGVPLGDRPLSGEQVDALGASLRRVFAAPVAAGTPERAWGPAALRAEVRRWLADDRDLSACLDPGVVAEAVAAWRTRQEDADDVDDEADPVLSRGDGNLANILWDGRTCRFVDFEDFGWSSLTYELTDVVEHASSRLRGLLDVDRLLAGFDLDEDRHERLRRHRRLMAAFWLGMLLPGGRGFAKNPPGSTEAQARHLLSLR